jgi:putative ABC transport system ATP-binding protein
VENQATGKRGLMKLRDLNSFYKKEKIYENLNIDFEEVGMTFIKGDSGSGKSTLLNILYGIKAYDGEYIIPEEITKFRRNNMSYIFQDYKVDPNLSVYDNIVLHLNIKDIVIDEDQIDALLDRCYMKHNKFKKAKFLSGGEKQRLAIVRALVSNPTVLLCDEPTGNLDEETSYEIFDILKEISETRLVIIASHSVDLIEKYSDRIYEVENYNLREVKNTTLPQLKYSDSQYGKMKRDNRFKLALRNYLRSAFKLNMIFAVFAIFSALFLVLNFSKASFDNKLSEKYQGFDGMNSTVVDLLGYSSQKEIDNFVEVFGYDTYIIDGIYNPDYLSGISHGLRRGYWSSRGGIPYSGSRTVRLYHDEFVDTGYKVRAAASYGEEYWDYYQNSSQYDNLYSTSEMMSDYAEFANLDLFAVSDFTYLSELIVHGRNASKDEVLINETSLISIIDEFNKVALSIGETKLVYEEMSSADIMNFIESYQMSIGYEKVAYYDEVLLDDYNFKIVGVIDDSSFKFDNFPYNLDQETFNTHRKHNRNLYVSIDYLLNQFQLMTHNYATGYDYLDSFEQVDVTVTDLNQFTGQEFSYQKTVVKLIDPDLILSNPTDVYRKELFKTVMFYEQVVDTDTYIADMDFLSKHKKVEDVKFTGFFYEMSEDYNNQQNVNKYILEYSVLIMAIGFFTAFISYVRYCMKRRSEFNVYELLGMEEKEKKSVFRFELMFASLNYLFLVVVFYFIFTVNLSGLIEKTITGLIYKTREFHVAYTFDVLSVLTLVLMFIPFLFTYQILKRKLIK